MNYKNKKLLLKSSVANKYESAIERHKRKKNKERIILFFIISFLIFLFWFFNSSYVKFKNIEVYGNEQLKREDILEIISLSNETKYWDVSPGNIQKTLINNYNIIKNVEVNKDFQSIKISIKEKSLLAREKNSEGIYLYVLDDGGYFEGDIVKDYSLPIIEGFNDNSRSNLIRNLSELKKEVLFNISEVTYDDSNNISYIYMKDGQKIKINPYNFSSKLNYYFEFEKNIDNKRDTILNLVNGAYLENNKSRKLKEENIKNILVNYNNKNKKEEDNNYNKKEEDKKE